MEKAFQLGGKVVLITGSMSGLGLATAKLCLNKKIKGLILLDIVENDSVLKELKDISNGADILFKKCDVSDAQDLAEAYNYAWNSFGYIHLAVHSAGIFNEDDSRAIVSVNVAGVIDGSMWLWNKMRKDTGGEGGTIINISSVAGILGQPTMPIYSATKHAVRSFGECLGNSLHYNRTGVRVLTICPGLTDTPLGATALRLIVRNQEAIDTGKLILQKPESVAKVIMETYEDASSGTVWVSKLDLPGIEHLPISENELRERLYL